ncbi:uncharacterized protein K460DRAFT_392883 [Cucurbitaria berberidis CBS 394.84]|uniref:Uncharacterized protein n=1 Tax=Cucurbitaria berberidis CBS 394.84 TaxID=1168544 RepID=A0A9P4L9Z5_9PLEO|nr:uncharacterized protein K460DRAFT_392883 [Cucurbitaria berberidis CBS 394.84]KAF1847550.1 hypothetical protein K460DRAFT_392883 [Cucurbitaria berberidis CBS 394.84]
MRRGEDQDIEDSDDSEDEIPHKRPSTKTISRSHELNPIAYPEEPYYLKELNRVKENTEEALGQQRGNLRNIREYQREACAQLRRSRKNKAKQTEIDRVKGSIRRLEERVKTARNAIKKFTGQGKLNDAKLKWVGVE